MWLENDPNEQALFAQWRKEVGRRRSKGQPPISYKEFVQSLTIPESNPYKNERAGLGVDDLWSLWRRDTAKRLRNNQLPVTYDKFVKGVQNQIKPEEEEDLRPSYAKPMLDRYDPESDEYTQWKDTMDTWEREDINRAKANKLMNTLVQKYSGIISEANKKAEYDRLIEDFSSEYKQDVDTTPIERYHFI